MPILRTSILRICAIEKEVEMVTRIAPYELKAVFLGFQSVI
jgi:hypothetical protein